MTPENLIWLFHYNQIALSYKHGEASPCRFLVAWRITIILIHLARAYTADVGPGRFLKNNQYIERENDFYAFRDHPGFKWCKK